MKPLRANLAREALLGQEHLVARGARRSGEMIGGKLCQLVSWQCDYFSVVTLIPRVCTKHDHIHMCMVTLQHNALNYL